MPQPSTIRIHPRNVPSHQKDTDRPITRRPAWRFSHQLLSSRHGQIPVHGLEFQGREPFQRIRLLYSSSTAGLE